MRGARHGHGHRTTAIRPVSAGRACRHPKLSHPVFPIPRSCQPAGVPGPAQHTRCQPGASMARRGAHSRALAAGARCRGPCRARHGRVTASGHVVAGLPEGAPDMGDPAESLGHTSPSLAADPGASAPACSHHAAPATGNVATCVWICERFARRAGQPLYSCGRAVGVEKWITVRRSPAGLHLSVARPGTAVLPFPASQLSHRLKGSWRSRVGDNSPILHDRSLAVG